MELPLCCCVPGTVFSHLHCRHPFIKACKYSPPKSQLDLPTVSIMSPSFAVINKSGHQHCGEGELGRSTAVGAVQLYLLLSLHYHDPEGTGLRGTLISSNSPVCVCGFG